MPRPPRLVLPHEPHHITQRGNHQEALFFSDQDRRVYLRLVQRAAERNQVRLWAYCLMSNHVHWIAVPASEQGLSRMWQSAHASYAQYRHATRQTTGHLWQSRFFSCVLGETHRWYAMAYVEQNPVRANMVAVADRYKWSSAGIHTGQQDNSIDLDLHAWQERYTLERWKDVLHTSLSQEALATRIREATQIGKPFASPESLVEWEKSTGRQLQATVKKRSKPLLSKAVSVA